MKKCSKCGLLNYESNWTCRTCGGTDFLFQKYNFDKWEAYVIGTVCGAFGLLVGFGLLKLLFG